MQEIPGYILKPSQKSRIERMTGAVSSALLGGRKMPPAQLGVREPLYIQMVIKVFIEGDEREMVQLYSTSGPVSSIRHAKSFHTMKAAQTVSDTLMQQSSREYKVLAIVIVSESDVAAHLKGERAMS